MLVSFVFLKAKAQFPRGTFNWLTDVVRAFPVDTAPDPDLDEFVDDVSADEIGSSRTTLTSTAINEDAAGDEVELDAADIVHSSVTTGSTAVGDVLYQQTGGDDTTPANDRLMAFLDYADTPTNGGDLTVQLASEGAIKL